VLFGTNIGTCITALLASIGTNRNARRTTVIHLLFNVIGTVIFTTLIMVLPVTDLIASVVDGPMAQIAAMHTTFNIVTTILLLPLGGYLAKLAVRILPELPEEQKGEGMHLEFLTPVHPTAKENILGTSAIYEEQLHNELMRMMNMARDNVRDGFHAIIARDTAMLERVEQVEDYLDYLNKEVSKHVSSLITYETNEKGSQVISSYFTITGNIERIGDHAMNVCGYTGKLVEKNIIFSAAANEEITQMQDICLKSMDILLQREVGDMYWMGEVAALEQKIDDMTSQFRRNHLERMRAGECSDEACIIYSELLTDFERIGDHVLNIGEELTAIHQLSA
jgi:phosphate:Na+ symporter